MRLILVLSACAPGNRLPGRRVRQPRDAHRLPGRPEPPLAGRPPRRLGPRPAGERRNRADDRLLVARSPRAGRRTPRTRSIPRTASTTSTSSSASRAARDGGHAHDLGHAAVGERRQGAELRADEAWRHGELREGARPPATRAGTTATRSSASTPSGTSRTSGSSSRRSTTRRQARGAGDLREIFRAATRRSRPATPRARRRRRDVRARLATATLGKRARRRPSAGQFAELSRSRSRC